jgi:hypothetical protein
MGAEELSIDIVANGTMEDFTFTPDQVPCEDQQNSGAAVWYHLVGTGFLMTLSGCPLRNDDGINISSTPSTNGNDDNVLLSVFGGDCDALECIRADRQQLCGGGTIIWATEMDKTYYILASTLLSDAEYELSVEQSIYNDICETAETLVPNLVQDGDPAANLTITIGRSFANSTLDFGLPSSCSRKYEDDHDAEESSSTGSPGVWFSVMGTGALLFRASTCTDDGMSPSSNSSISVYSDPCTDLECVDVITTTISTTATEIKKSLG